MNATDTGLVVRPTNSAAEELAKRIPQARVVSAFGTVPSEVFFRVFDARNAARRPSRAYCGDDKAAKDVAATLIRDVGFDPVVAGSLRIARYLEPFALLTGQLAYEGEDGPEIAHRFERFPSYGSACLSLHVPRCVSSELASGIVSELCHIPP